MPEWLIERGIGETRAALVDDGEIVEARIELDGTVPAGTVLTARLVDVGVNGRNAAAATPDGAQYLLPRGAAASAEGAAVTIEVTREAIPGAEPWKRPLARVTEDSPSSPCTLAQRLGGRQLIFPGPADPLRTAGWDDLLDEARTGIVRFAGGELRICPTPAMTLIDVDGFLPPDELAARGAAYAAGALRRLGIGGSIGIDLPAAGGKAARQAAAAAIDEHLPQPFERTAVNGFGFVQIVRPRRHASLIELGQDRAAFETRALLRRAAFERSSAKRLVAHPALIALFEAHREWVEALADQSGGIVSLRADPRLAMSGGYVEPA